MMTMKTLPIEHLSYSSISLFLTCGKAWKYRYIDKVQAAPSPNLIIGSCVHDTVEKIVGDHSLGIDCEDITVVAHQIIANRLENEDGINNTPEAENVRNEVLRIVEAPLIKSAVNLLRAKVDENGPMIERKVTLEVPEVDVPIIGYIDIILDDGTPADFKTATRSWTLEKAQSELQPVFYLGAMGQMGMPVNWKFQHLVMIKNKVPKFQMFEHEHKAIEVFRLCENVQKVWKSMNEGTFLPDAPGSWKCSPKVCEYWNICQGTI